MKQKTRIFLFTLSVLVFSGTLSAQENFAGYAIAPQVGAYIANNADQMGFSAGLKASGITRRLLISASYNYGEEWLFLGDGPERQFNQLAALFGTYNDFGRIFRLEYQAGLSAFWGTKHTEYHSTSFLDGYYDIETYEVVGFNAEVGAVFVPKKYFGFGFHFQFDLNEVQSISQFLISVSFGKLKK